MMYFELFSNRFEKTCNFLFMLKMRSIKISAFHLKEHGSALAEIYFDDVPNEMKRSGSSVT